ncbi:MAG: MFS transporter [Betaproteobacteria bacterium]|nr:MFS transporter [Betaproteobacteria bacterium]
MKTQQTSVVDSPRAWLRLAAAFCISAIGTAGMWLPPVVLPMLQAEFGTTRSGASLPYTATMVGVALGTVLMGRLMDRIGIFRLLVMATIALGAGYTWAGHSGSLWQFALIQGALIAFLGCTVTFAPLIADTSHWFLRYRGRAMAICAAGNYLGGMLWPPIVQRVAEAHGWRNAYLVVGAVTVAVLLPLIFLMRARPPAHDDKLAANAPVRDQVMPLGLKPNTLMALVAIMGVACCVAMSMPQVHIVAYCADLGYGPARGAEMLSLMLGLGIVSRLGSGWIADRIGGLRTLIFGSAMQVAVLVLFLPFSGLTSLYLISALFGLVQGGIVPSYAIVVREYFPAREAGTRIGVAITATLFGMALGGWLTGAIFDLTGSYRAAFLHGIAWNILNLAIAGWLLLRGKRSPMLAHT